MVDPKQLANAHSSSDRSITDELADLEAGGVDASFAVIPGARLRCSGCHMVHDAEDMQLVDVRRLEGKSDPSEEACVLTLRCGHCGTEGACIISFGPLASAEDQDVFLALQDDRS